MATKKVVEMDEVELRVLLKEITERMAELQKEKNKELMKTISIGKYVLYSKNEYDKIYGIVNIITEDYIGVKGEDSKKNRRILYEDIVAVSDKVEEEWIEKV